MAEYLYPVDIANRALVHCGISPNIVASPVSSAIWTGSKNAVVMSFLYDKIRTAMLRTHIWRCAVTFATLLPGSPATVTYPDGQTRNIYDYPTTYIRPASQDSRSQGTIQQRSSGGIQYSDYDFIMAGIITAAVNPTFFYVSDIMTVSTMDPLFCEAFAARLAMAAVPALTQSPQKLQQIEPIYMEYIDQAIAVDAIEVGNMEGTGKSLKTERLNIQLVQPQQPRGGGQNG